MIKNGYPNNPRSFDQSARGVNILHARGRVACRVVVNDDHGGGAFRDSLPKNFSGVHWATVHKSARDFLRCADDAGFRVQQDHEKAFLLPSLEDGRHQSVNGLRFFNAWLFDGDI